MEYSFNSRRYEVDEGVGVDTQVTLTVVRTSTGTPIAETIGNVQYQREMILPSYLIADTCWSPILLYKVNTYKCQLGTKTKTKKRL